MSGKNPVPCGVYRTPADIIPLRKSCAQAGCAWFSLDLGAVRDRPALFSECGRALGLPESFGANWDALADCLQDWSWQPAPGYVLHFRGASAFASAAPADFDLLIEILRDAATYWNGRGKSWIALIDGAESLPPCRA